MNSEHFHLTEDDHCAWFECVTCGEELIFSKHARFDEIKKALDDHACVPTGMRLNPVFSARAASPLVHLLILSILFWGLISTPLVALGQTAAGDKAGVVTGAATRPLRFDAEFYESSAQYWGGVAFDYSTSRGKRELNPAVRNSEGRISAGKFFALNGVVYSASLLLPAKIGNWTRRIVGWVHFGFGGNNLRAR